MSDKKTERKSLLILIGILLVVLSSIACLIFAFVTDNLAEMPVPARVRILGEYKIAEDNWEKLDYDKSIPANKGDIILQGKLILTDKDGNFVAPVTNGMEMTLYLNHINVEVFINEQKTHIFDVENPRIGHQACVKDWTNFKYTGNEDDVIKIVIHNSHKFGNSNAVNELLNSMYWGNTIIWQDWLTTEGAVERFVGFFVMVISFLMIGIAIFATILKLKNIGNFWCVSLISLFASGYFIFSSKNITLWNKESILDNYGLVISLMLGIFFSLCLTNAIIKGKLKRIGIGVAIILGLSEAILYISVCNKLINLYDILLPFLIISFFAIIMMIGCCVARIFRTKSKQEGVLLSCCSIFLSSIVFDILNINFLWWPGFYLSKFVFLIIFLIGIGIAIIKIPKYFAISLKSTELEKELKAQKLSLMLSQIQPHFMFNSLTTIMYLCEENPSLAKETLEKFSFFLRGTLESIELKECVSINYELEIVKNYLCVEKQRFGDKLEIEYDLKSEDFLIPILSIQPIVENAVRHGIRKKSEGGKVIISTFSEKDYHVVRVSDNGVGFSSEVIEKAENIHIGIKNVKERVELMIGGTIEIISEIDVGTNVSVKIPRK